MTPPSKVKLTGGAFQDSEGNLLAQGYLELKLSQDESISGVGQIASGIEIKILLDANASVLGTSSFTLTAVATSVSGSAVYTGTVSGGDSNAFVGLTFVVAAFTTTANNGTFVCTASSATTLTLANASASAETHAATATASQAVWGVDQMSPTNAYYRVTGFTVSGQPAWGPNNQQVTGNGGTFDVGTWVPNQVVSWSPSLQPLDLETNGLANSDQFRLNFEDSISVQWSVDSNGNLQAIASGLPTPPGDATEFLNGASSPSYAHVKDSDLSLSNITTNDVSITKHGFAPILPNDATVFLDGTGNYSSPSTSGVASVDLTAQQAAVSPTNLVTGAVAKLYRISYYLEVTQAATTSSTLAVTFGWTDRSSTTQSFSTPSIVKNQVGYFIADSFVVQSAAAANLTYATVYSSSGATPMQYSLQISVEKLN